MLVGFFKFEKVLGFALVGFLNFRNVLGYVYSVFGLLFDKYSVAIYSVFVFSHKVVGWAFVGFCAFLTNDWVEDYIFRV